MDHTRGSRKAIRAGRFIARRFDIAHFLIWAYLDGMKGTSKYYPELREYLESVPIVDCHDHSETCGPKYEDAIQVVVSGYFPSDLESASEPGDMAVLIDSSKSIEERWPVLARLWKRTCHTGYAMVTRLVLEQFYGEKELSLEALKRINERLLNLEDEKIFDDILEKANIAVRIQNIWTDPKNILDGSYKPTPRSRITIPLPDYHAIRSYNTVQVCVAPVGRSVTDLDEYLQVCREIFEGYKKFGAVAFKDQSAYERTLAYDNPARSEAEAVFNWFMEDPRRSASFPDGTKPLNDFLFHEFMRMARDMDLPVQIHTGHMAGIRNDIVKTNAIGLTRVIELHRDVQFDLFHANWPYSGELVYLGKNFPNVALDFCWANIIDPIYCQNLFKQALSSVPHGKIHGYGSDFLGSVDRAWAHAKIARDNIAIALSDMMDIEYLDINDAKKVGRAWLFSNANEFFRL